MTSANVRGDTVVAGVVGRPIEHSLSPILHNAWIAAAGMNAVYVPFSPAADGFSMFVDGLRGGMLRGVNVTLPFKEVALSKADEISASALDAGAANVLLFRADGVIEARNTDGEGLLYALARQAPLLELHSRPTVIIGAGGAARGALAGLRAAGARDIRIVNRTKARAEDLAGRDTNASGWGFEQMPAALDGAGLIVNATSAEIAGGSGLALDFALAPHAVAMDMLYRPLKTRFLSQALAAGLTIVDGLDMLIGQAIPSFEAFFGAAPPQTLDARALLIGAMDADR